MKHSRLLLLLALPLLWTSCDNDPNFPEATYFTGVYISEEGSGAGGGTVSYIDRSIGGVERNIYQLANSTAIGGSVQSLCLIPGFVYVVCSDKIVQVDVYEFKNNTSIPNFMEAREMVTKDTLGFISEWRSSTDSGWVRVVHIGTNQVLDTLKVGKGPTKMLQAYDKVLVCNSLDSTVSVINTTTVAVENHIAVGDFPQNIISGAGNVAWVLCKGKDAASGGPTAGKLVPIGLSTLTIGTVLTFPVGNNPDFLAASGAFVNNFYYYYNAGIYRVDATNPALPPAPLIHTVGTTNAVGVDPETGFVYVADRKNGLTDGRLRWYNGTTGLWVDSSDVGIKPNNFLFVNP